MSKHNRNNNTKAVSVDNEVVESVLEETEVVKPAVEESEIVEVIEPVVEEVTELETINTTVGVVTDCIKLNIRNKPNVNAKVLCTVNVLSELIIDTQKSNDNWLSVCTESGVEGFCMKKYVIFKQ